VAALRDRLRALVAAGQLEPLDMNATVAAIYAWDKIFINPLSVANLDVPAPREHSEDPVVRALCEPLPPRVRDAGALVAAQPTALGKLLTAIWLVAVPPTAVTPADRERFVAHALSICAVLPPLTMPVAAPLAYALSVNAFRASYGGGNIAPAIAAIGRFVASTMQRHFPAFAQRPPRRERRERVRIGYVSANFRRHAVTSYMASRVLCRDRDRFEAILFALGGKSDDVTAELAASADRFVALEPFPLERAAAAIRDADLDVLVHCDIGMDFATHLLAGFYLAPRQIALMGHAATTGMPPITHYLGGDCEPPYAQAHYSEKLVRLPACGAAQRPPPPAPHTFTRAQLGIPDDAIVLGNFGHALKHGPARDALYAEILARVPRAHLVVKPFFSRADFDQALDARLRRLGRVTIVPHLDSPLDVAGLYSLVDIQLDTFPFGGWTTNLDALHAGVPIVTQLGDTVRGRWGDRFLELCGVEIGRARSDRDYVEAAVLLAADDATRRRVSSQIRETSGRFFDGPSAQAVYERTLFDIIEEEGSSG
jgi:predicted O-linked N-acetylglucosamine transferase (SPINDLY family)